MSATSEAILQHKARVKKWMQVFIDELKRRAKTHDDSKLRSPELENWEAMDREPRYKYGTPEYFAKLKKYHWLLELHWKKNRHHPEYWHLNEDAKNRDLLDYIEMLCDWMSYSNEKISYSKARSLVIAQTKRYRMDNAYNEVDNPPMSELLLNTLSNYFVKIGGEEEKKDKELYGRIDVLA